MATLKAHEMPCRIRITGLLNAWAITVNVTLIAIETQPNVWVGSFALPKTQATLFNADRGWEQFTGRAYVVAQKDCYVSFDRVYDRGDVWLVHVTGNGNLLGDAKK